MSHTTDEPATRRRPPKKIRELVICGGGMCGIMLLGTVKYMQDRGKLRSVRRFVGTSIGSIICVLLILGYDGEQIMGVMRGIPFASFHDVDCDGLLAFFDTFGMMTARRLLDVVRAFLRVKGVNDAITFAELHAMTARELVVTGYNVSRGRLAWFSHASHPTMPVVQAVEISICLPFIFRPIQFEGDLYLDGGLIDNVPFACIQSRSRSIVLKMVSGEPEQNPIPGDIFEYTILMIKRVLDALSYARRAKERHCHVLSVAVRDGWRSLLNFQMDNAAKDNLFIDGYEQALKHFTDIRRPTARSPRDGNNLNTRVVPPHT